MTTTTNTTKAAQAEVDAFFNQFTGVAKLEAIYWYWIREYELAKKAKQFGHADECASKAHLIGKRLLVRFGASEQYLTQIREEALATV
jgi:hypothetical protein